MRRSREQWAEIVEEFEGTGTHATRLHDEVIGLLLRGTQLFRGNLGVSSEGGRVLNRLLLSCHDEFAFCGVPLDTVS